MDEIRRQAEALVLAHPTARDVVERSSADLLHPEKPAFRAAYARAARLLGAHARELAGVSNLPDRARPHWSLLDWTRLFLLLRAIDHTSPEAVPTLVLTLYEGGEIGEQESLLRTLSLLPSPERYLEVGVAACRTNAHRVFEAIACENPFPAEHFPDLAFNQMVMKAIFLEVSVNRIEGLSTRVTPELARMAADYGSERRAAGRPVPADVDRLVQAVRTAP